MILVDTNVLIDLATNDPVWADWSQQQLDAAAMRGPLIIDEIVYAELSVGFAQVEALDAFLAEAEIEMRHLPKAALFLAGKAFARYRKAGGARKSILADFFIGAHAAVSMMPLLTRDAGRYRTYFPTLDLIAP